MRWIRKILLQKTTLRECRYLKLRSLLRRVREQGGEQISLLSDELEDNEKSKEILLSENEELRRQVKELESRPVEVAGAVTERGGN